MSKIKNWSDKDTTNRYYILQLPDPFQSQAIENTPANFLDKEADYDTPYEVISACFVFNETPQGGDYWVNVKTLTF